MKIVLSMAVALVVTLLAACGGTTSSQPLAEDAGPAGGDAATRDIGTPDPPDGGLADGGGDSSQACNALVNVAQTIGIANVPSDPPLPQGGTIVDGTYAMTAATLYTGAGGPSGPSGLSAQITVQIAGSVVHIVSSEQSPNNANATIASNNTTLITTNTCPDTKVQQVGYTATPTSITVILPAGSLPDGGAKTLVELFTKQ